MTLVVAHRIDGKLAVITDGAGNSGPKCGLLPCQSAIVAGWGEYDLPPTFLCSPPTTVHAQCQDLARANYIGDALPDPKNCRDNFVTAFERELNKSPNVHNGGRGPAGLLLVFVSNSGIEGVVYDANSGKGSWQPRPGVLSWPVFFGQVHEVNDMLSTVGINAPADFVGAVTSIDHFAVKVKELIRRTSDHMASKRLVRSIDLPAWLTVLSEDGSVSTPTQLA